MLARLEAFRRIVELGSVAAAARSLSRSPAAISRQLSSLEEELGQKLLIRDSHQAAVTAEGRRFYEHALVVLRAMADARESVQPDRSPRGVVVLGASVSFGTFHVVPLVPALFAKHPRLQVELRLEDRTSDLVGEGVDVAIRAGLDVPDSSDLIAHRLASQRRLLLGAPAYFAAHGEPTTPAELAHHAFICGPRPGASKLRFQRGGAEHVVSCNGSLRVETLIAQREAAIVGLGLVVLTEAVAREPLRSGQLRPTLTSFGLPPAPVAILHRREQSRSPRVRALVAFLRDRLGDGGADGGRTRPPPGKG